MSMTLFTLVLVGLSTMLLVLIVGAKDLHAAYWRAIEKAQREGREF